MTRDQRTVAAGAASGIGAMLLMVWGFSALIAAPSVAGNADRLAYALRWAVVAALPLVFVLGAVGNARFASEAIDPTVGKESQQMVVDGRVADNTLQQFLLFLVGMLALSVSLPADRLNILAAVSITFVIVRVAFWIGYRINPLYRAFGFSSTFYMNLGMMAASLWLWLR